MIHRREPGLQQLIDDIKARGVTFPTWEGAVAKGYSAVLERVEDLLNSIPPGGEPVALDEIIAAVREGRSTVYPEPIPLFPASDDEQ